MVSSGDGGKIEQGVGADAGRGNVKKLEEDSEVGEVAEMAREEDDDDEKKELALSVADAGGMKPR